MTSPRFLCLGRGDAFSADSYSSSLALEYSGKWLLIDCPHPIRKILREAPLPNGATLDLKDISALVLTHLHADHASGVEGLMYYTKLVDSRRMPLVAHPEVSRVLWDQQLAAARAPKRPGDGADGIREFNDFFEGVALDESQGVDIGPFHIECRRTQHPIPTFALRIKMGDKSLAYSADTPYDPALIDWLAQADLIVHETNHGIHTPYDALEQLPSELRARMRLIHYPDAFDLRAHTQIGVLCQGGIYEVGMANPSPRLLDGKALAARLRSRLQDEISDFRGRTGVTPGLAVILVGNNPASEVYVKNKRSAAKAAGIDASLIRLPSELSEEALIDCIDRLNADTAIHGILVQLPLPRHINEARVLERVDPNKDVDGFHPVNAGLLALGRPQFVPCTPLGIREMLRDASVPTAGAHVVVMGRSNVVGKPMAQLLGRKGSDGDATVTIAHTATRDPARLARQADILIVAAGQPELVDANWVKPGATVIDVGIHKRENGTLCGDVHFESVSRVAGAVSPVPGGVGPMTIAMLLRNTFDAARRAHARRAQGDGDTP